MDEYIWMYLVLKTHLSKILRKKIENVKILSQEIENIKLFKKEKIECLIIDNYEENYKQQVILFFIEPIKSIK